MNNNFSFMAFGHGQVSTEAVATPKYIGVAPVTILAINPNKTQLESIYGRAVEEEPKYVSQTNPDAEGKVYPSVMISVFVKTDKEATGIDYNTRMTFFLQKKYRKGSMSGKYQVIDKYGRTAWATQEDIQAKKIPMYTNGPANIDVDYRPCYIGEEELTAFLKNYMNIPEVKSYVNGAWIDNPNVKPEECEARLENIDKYFTGDFSELKEIIGYQPNNKVKVLFGVRTSEDNKQYQTIYNKVTLRNNSSNFAKLEKEIQSAKETGALANTEYEICPLKEYVVKPSDLSSSSSEMPFDSASSDVSPW